MDLFGLDEHYNRVIVVFSTERKKPVVIKMDDHPHNKSLGKLSEVAHVVLDLNHDYLADLCLSTSNGIHCKWYRFQIMYVLSF